MKTRWLDRINQWVFRFRHLWAVGSFCLGLASYFMVERKPWLAAVLTAFLITTWLVLLTENLWSRRFKGTAMEQMSQGALKLLLQGVHQEAFFFSLPFVVLQWSGGAEYFLFTALVAGTALVSIIDPLYFRLAGHRALYFGFHAWALFVALLVLLPLIFKWPTNQALDGAAWLTALFALPSFWRVGGPRPAYRWVMLGLSSLCIAAVPVWAASLVPPLTLSLEQRAVSLNFNRAQRQPLAVGDRFQRGELGDGLYAYTAIRAPLGLGQSVSHYWFHDGELTDKVPLQVSGGRREGYRTWSHKSHFPGDPAGHWRVEVRTDNDQIVGVLRFEVAESASAERRERGPARLSQDSSAEAADAERKNAAPENTRKESSGKESLEKEGLEKESPERERPGKENTEEEGVAPENEAARRTSPPARDSARDTAHQDDAPEQKEGVEQGGDEDNAAESADSAPPAPAEQPDESDGSAP
ncbi:hypothetical protein CEK62_03465 [Alcanivorax sp. N3-2A]|nr:hypothetical protein CEK62_03465 [Alcanivorax sp. N3-2A]|tara:strand:- start:7330 stop:8739 length:1410 start_codon:yes stop_codon:yes gene_type:complete